MSDTFPEERYRCYTNRRASYEALLHRGRNKMRKERAVVCALARSLGPLVHRTIARIEQLGELFGDHRIIVYENDSNDATPQALRVWRHRNPRVTVLSEKLGVRRFPSLRSEERAVRMAEYRNTCRQVALEQCGDYDYVVVVDTDLEGGWSYDGVANTIGQSGWDAVGANGLIYREEKPRWTAWRRGPRYYPYCFDTWALRLPGHPDAHVNQQLAPWVLPRGAPMEPVLSCFGGLAIYRMEAMKQAVYAGPDCEHVMLHRHMADNGHGRIFLNPSLICVYNEVPAEPEPIGPERVAALRRPRR